MAKFRHGTRFTLPAEQGSANWIVVNPQGDTVTHVVRACPVVDQQVGMLGPERLFDAQLLGEYIDGQGDGVESTKLA